MPLYRQSAMLERDTGLELSRATLDGWVLRVGELLVPVAAAMKGELIGGGYIQADETPVEVQLQEGRGKNHQGYLWQYGKLGGAVVFDFRLGRESAQNRGRSSYGNLEGEAAIGRWAVQKVRPDHRADPSHDHFELINKLGSIQV